MLTPNQYENRPRFNRVGIYLGMLVVLGLSLAALVYVFQMQQLGWVVGRFGSPSSALVSGEIRVALYRSEATARYLASVGGNVEVLLQPWRDHAKAQSVQLTEVLSLTDLDPADGKVLVLPSAIALSNAERDAVLRYQMGGGAVLLTWATGSRDGAGQWVGWSFLKSVAGVTVTGELSDSAAIHHLVAKGQGPISHGLRAGQRVQLGKAVERSLLMSGAPVAAEPSMAPAGTDSAQSGLVVFQEFPEKSDRPSSRVVVLGVPETQWAAQEHDMHTLVSGALRWLVRQPAVVPADWPDGRPAAHMVVVDAQSNLPAALTWVDALQQTNKPVTLFVSADEAKAHSSALQGVRSRVDVGYQGDARLGFAGQPEATQAQRISGMVAGMSSVLDKPGVLMGFDPPLGSFDETTDRLLYNAGVRYRTGATHALVGDIPFFQGVRGERSGERFVVLPVWVQGGGAGRAVAQVSAEPWPKQQQAAFDAVVRRGTLGVLGLRSEDATADSPPSLGLPGLVAHWAKDKSGLWWASGADIARWWNDKERFQVGVRASGARLEVDVSVLGSADFAGGALVVMLPREGVLPTVRGLKAGMPTPQVQLLDRFRALIRFDALPVGNYSYQLTF